MPQTTAKLQQAVSIQLDAPTRVYAPGDTITGVLNVPENVHRMPTLVLQGIVKTKTQFEYSGTCRGRTPVVWQRITLEDIDTDEPDNGAPYKSFRFSTTIPLECTEVPPSVPTPKGKGKEYWDYPWTWQGDSRFLNRDSVSAPLPPTCRFHSDDRNITDCQVEYAIVALDLSAEGASEMLTSSPFWLTSLSTSSIENGPGYVLHDDKRLQFSANQLSPEGRPKLTAMQRFQSGSMSSPTPQTAFLVKVARPKVVQAGLPIDLWVELMPQDTDAVRFARTAGKKLPSVVPIPMPNISLTEAKFELEQITVARTRGRKSDSDDKWQLVMLALKEPPIKVPEEGSQDSSAVMHWSAADLLTSQAASEIHPSWLKKNDSLMQPSMGDVNLNRRVAFQVALPERLTPTFKSHNIARRYQWRLGLTFECVGQSQQVYYRFPELTVLPPNVNGDKRAQDAMDWGEYKLDPEPEVIRRWFVALEVGGKLADFGWNVASTVLSFM